jgi:hypothetical protein
MALCCNKMFSFAKEMNVYKLINATFAPPKANYSIIDCEKIGGLCYKKMKFVHTDYGNIKYPYLEVESYMLRRYIANNKIVLLHIKNISNKQPVTIIFSHGGSSDLGTIYPFLIDLSTQLKVSIT